MIRRRRLLLLAALLLLDVGALSTVTAWVLRRHRPAVQAIYDPRSPTTSGTGDVGRGGAPRVAALPPPVPQASSTGSDHRLTGGPKWVIAAATDTAGTVWIGTEDQGVWAYQNGDNWQQFMPADGLGDADATAIVADRLGRVWVGGADRGLSIFNGQAWRTYDRFAGPGGSHVFCLATCPTDGDVWMGTDAGLARYSLKGDRWTTYDRSTGLPAAQVTCLAFDSAGNLFAGLGAEGVGIAHADDGYARWTSVTGPDDLPIVASGPGLPSPLVNAVLVARDDTVYVGTCHGLARSADHGASWTFVRGRNWPQISKGRYDGVPANFAGTPAGPLLEDWVSALAQDPAGVLWVGYREAGYQAFANPADKSDHAGKGKLTAMAFTGDGVGIFGTDGDGVVECGTTYAAPPARPPEPADHTDAFPTPAPAPGAAELDALRQRVEALPPGRDGVDFLGDDWGTSGDWTGRYGRQFAQMVGFHTFTAEAGYAAEFDAGPYRHAYPRYLYEDDAKTDRGQLDPRDGHRVFCEENDESFNTRAHPTWQQGPDAFLGITLPAGVHRVGLYYHNFDGHQGAGNHRREHPILAKGPVAPPPAALDPDAATDDASFGFRATHPFQADVAAAELAPTLARSRLPRYWRPVFKQFLVRGAGTYWFKVDRNASEATKTQGIYVDRLDRRLPCDPAYPRPPAARDYTADPGVKGSAARLWSALDAAVGRQGYAGIAGRARSAAYLAAASAGVDADTLAAWRWQLPLWLADDRSQFDAWAKAIPRPAKAKAK